MPRYLTAFCLLLLTIVICAPAFKAQVTPGAGGKAKVHGEQQIYAGYSYLTKDFRGGSGLNGWEVAYTAPLTTHFGIKVESFGYHGSDNSATQNPIYFVTGAQYTHNIGKERIFVDGLIGMVHINSDWFYGNGYPSGASNNSYAAVLGGGLDTPISKHFAWRVEGSMVNTNIGVGDNQIHGLPNYFGRASTGVVFRF